MPPKLLRDYLDALGNAVTAFSGDPDTVITGAAGDSRSIQPGNLFVAIRGAKMDGAAFVADALKAGAGAVVAEQPVDLPDNVPFIQVKNGYVAAGRIAETAADCPAAAMNILGITGTNGKTTCAYFLRDVLRAAGSNVGMIGTIQYEIGDDIRPAERTTPTPFELQKLFAAMRQAGVDTVVMEVSSHALDQRRPGTARFAAGLFTNLTRDHGDYHKTRASYFAAKKVLFEEYLEKDAPAVVNADDACGRQLLEELNVRENGPRPLGFGYAEDAQYRIHHAHASLDGIAFQLDATSRTLNIRSPVIGPFNIENLAGCLALADAYGIDAETAGRVAAQFRGPPGRLQPLTSPDGVKAFVDYAHTDDALNNVLQTLRELEPKRLFVLFGCGGDRDRSKRPLMARVAATLADRVYVTSDNPRSEDPRAIIADVRRGIPEDMEAVCVPDRREAIGQAVADAAPGDIILVAGKGHETYQEIGGEKHPFSDVAEVQHALATRPA